ncbi:MAG: hypothetical protein H7A37_00295 [Chlamydiales bacterium]|nr:hypothetical protein [Chlamydiia bacterium]MCP5506734.1 hypothetical protein [Chlamydiales bacterium]
MHACFSYGKVSFLLLSLFLCSCVPQPSRCWQHYCDDACEPQYRTVKTWLPAVDRFQSLELEVLTNNEGTYVFINTFSLPIPSAPGHPSKAFVTITIDDSEQQFLADRLEGGQRLRLPEDAAQLLIGALKSQQCIQVRTGRYSADVTTTNFTSY